MISVLHAMMLGTTFLLSLLTTAAAGATSYFSELATTEKEEYTDWVRKHSKSYPRHVFMPSTDDQKDGAALFWNIDEDTIKIAIAVQAEGWVGFGLSEAGGMRGADMSLFQASNPSELVDAHVVEDRSMPLTDDCQDWMLLNNTVSENGWMIVEMSRLLDTGDEQDHAIKNDVDLWAPPTRIIAAWGDGDVSHHGGRRARSSVRLFANHSNEMTERQALVETLEEESDGNFGVLEDNFIIPAVETYYHEKCFTRNELAVDIPEGETMLTVIGAVPVIKETAEFVHHFLVYLQKDCTDENVLTRTLLYAWAPGDEGWALPSDVGFPLFDDLNNQAVLIQIHYDNPTFKAGMKDSSGVRFYYSHDEREHRAGVLQVGDPWVALQGKTIEEGLTQYSFTCPGTCSSSILAKKERSGESEGVTVFSEMLHMHQKGVRMTSEVIRDGNVFHKAVVDVYDFEQQGGFHVPQTSYEILPGDSFRTTCQYRGGSTFGLSSQEEMCIAFIMYYPAMQSSFGEPWICPHEPGYDLGPGCAQELEYAKLDDSKDLGRRFGASSGKCATNPPVSSSNIGAESPHEPLDQPAPTQNDESIIIDIPVQEGTSGAGQFGMVFIFISFPAFLLGFLI